MAYCALDIEDNAGTGNTKQYRDVDSRGDNTVCGNDIGGRIQFGNNTIYRGTKDRGLKAEDEYRN